MKKTQPFQTVPLERPYLMPLEVKHETNSATRKLRDFGVYRAAHSRNFNVQEKGQPRIWHENFSTNSVAKFPRAESALTISELASPLSTENRNDDEDYLIAAAEHYTFERL